MNNDLTVGRVVFGPSSAQAPELNLDQLSKLTPKASSSRPTSVEEVTKWVLYRLQRVYGGDMTIDQVLELVSQPVSGGTSVEQLRLPFIS